MVNFNLYVAQKTFPKKSWRIITNERHSCVWDGESDLFDINYFALVPDVKEHPFYEIKAENMTVLPVGEFLEVNRVDDHDVKTLDDYDAGLLSLDEIEIYAFSY